MLASTFALASMQALVRYLSHTMHPLEVVFFRNLFGVVVLMPLFARHGLSMLRTTRFGLHLWRALLNVVAMSAFFWSLALIPLVQAQALNFTAPLFTAALAALLLGEKVVLRRWVAIVLGFGGALLILRPGLEPIPLGALLTLSGAALWGLTMIVIKVLSRTDSALGVTAWMVLLMTPLSLPGALLVWVWPTPMQWMWLFACGLLGNIGQFLVVKAFREADTTVVLPLDFAKIIWGALIAWLFFSEVVDLWTWAGAVVVFSGGVYVALHERQAQRPVTGDSSPP
jgi:drug/metabolite transporter (DMT)-like permease